MFWNITAANWALLWSSIIGAIIAGGTAALVAMVVLRKTNAHQAELAIQESVRQEARSARALKEQREILERQLSHQRSQTELTRRRESMADAVDALMLMGRRPALEFVEYKDLATRARTALVRWRFNEGNGSIARAAAGMCDMAAYAAGKSNKRCDRSPGTQYWESREARIIGQAADLLVAWAGTEDEAAVDGVVSQLDEFIQELVDCQSRSEKS